MSEDDDLVKLGTISHIEPKFDGQLIGNPFVIAQSFTFGDAAFVRALRWTKEKPTEPGWVLVRDPNKPDDWNPALIFDFDDSAGEQSGLWVDGWRMRPQFLAEFNGMEWSDGPIPEPLEPL